FRSSGSWPRALSPLTMNTPQKARLSILTMRSPSFHRSAGVNVYLMVDIKILSEPLDITACLAAVTTDECGGEVLFTGTVRNKTQGKPVVRLEYECYESMARKELKKIADYATEKWEVS